MPNPLSYVLHNGTGSQTSFSFAGIDDYLSVGYIKVYLNDVLQTTGYTINAGAETVNFSPTAPASGVKVKIARETPNTSAGFTGNIVDFSNGSVLTADDLDKGFKGLLHIVQESNDTGSGALGKTTDQLGWNAAALPVKNAGQAIDPGDLVTKAQMDAVSLYGASTIPQSWADTGNGSKTSFTLNPLPSSTNADMFIVEVGGVLQRPTTDYSLTTNALVFVTAPGNNIGIRVRNFGVARNALDVVPNGSITNAYMAANSIATANIQDDAVTAAKLADNSVFTLAIQDDAITQAKIADDAVGNDQMAVNSVNTDQLVSLSVTTPKIANNSITSAKFVAASVDTTALGLNAVALDNMKGSGFTTSTGTPRLLHVDGSGFLSAKNLSTIGFGGVIAANLDFANTYKCLGLTAPAANGDALRYNEAFDADQIASGWKLSTPYSTARRHLMFGTSTHNSSTITGSPEIATFFELTGGGFAQLGVKTGYGSWMVMYLTLNTSSNAVTGSGVIKLDTGTPQTVQVSNSKTLFIALRYS
jgi:hypothetical protein